MLKLSIIIPVYNVEAYITKCIYSCLDQDLKTEEYEILVVDDGSPDGSITKVQVIQDKQKRDSGVSNIRIIGRKNGGLSAARNTGIKEAKGDYIWFVDSDDWIEKKCLKSITDFAYSESLDVVCFGFQFVSPEGKITARSIVHEESKKIYSGHEFFFTVGMPPAAWLALYKRDYLINNHLIFYEGIIHEDQEFTPRAYCLARRISFIDMVAYNYNQREGGIMKSSRNIKRCRDFLKVSDSLYQFTKDNVIKNSQTYNCLFNRIAFVFTQSLAFYSQEAFPLSFYKRKEYYPFRLSSIRGSLKYKCMIANISLSLYVFVYKFMKKSIFHCSLLFYYLVYENYFFY